MAIVSEDRPTENDDTGPAAMTQDSPGAVNVKTSEGGNNQVIVFSERVAFVVVIIALVVAIIAVVLAARADAGVSAAIQASKAADDKAVIAEREARLAQNRYDAMAVDFKVMKAALESAEIIAKTEDQKR